MIDLTIVIPTFNRAALLHGLLRHLSVQSWECACFEIIVCDSGSSDETAAVVEQFDKMLNIRLLQTENSLAMKRNDGMRAASSDFVVFLDDDCWPESNFVETYVYLKRENVRNVAYCGEVRFPEEWVSTSNYYRFRDSLHPAFPMKNPNVEFKNIVCMNMGVWKQEFCDAIGGFDEEFIGYGCEDIDTGVRLTRAGFALRMVGPRILHYEGSSSISQYMVKIHRASRDGMSTFLQRQPVAAKMLLVSRLIEPSLDRGFLEKSLGLAIRTASAMWYFNGVLETFLKKTDRKKSVYCRFFYRYLMIVASVRGVNDRTGKLSRRAAQAGWY
jgi:glycosyltransferase involved in cell wall biosynthesis